MLTRRWCAQPLCVYICTHTKDHVPTLKIHVRVQWRWKHGNNQHALVPQRRNVAAQVAEELKTVTYATPSMEERGKKKIPPPPPHKNQMNLSNVPTLHHKT